MTPDDDVIDVIATLALTAAGALLVAVLAGGLVARWVATRRWGQ